jgi:hypothetical protein
LQVDGNVFNSLRWLLTLLPYRVLITLNSQKP